jgi:PKD repeat protein
MNPLRPFSGRRVAGAPLLILLVSAWLALAAPAGVANAATGDVGYQDGSTSGTGSPTGTKRPESALWFNDGLWWANMWDPVSDDFHIFRLNAATQTWSDTAVTIDSRSGTSADTLWDGSHLYVSSHAQSSTASSGKPSYLFRFSYNPLSRTYALDSGFPAQINNVSTETLVIAKDSTGRLWATWQQGSKIYVNRTLGDDKTWGTPFVLPASSTSVNSDDISSIVAFGGNKIGVLWGNQNSSQDGFYFAVHDDGQPDTTWRATESAWRGSGIADDHINLKADSSGRVFAAVKTSLTGSASALTALLVRSATGQWSHATVDTAGDCPNRPTVVIDEAAGVAHVFETGPSAPSFSCSDQGGDIYEKTASLSTLAFPTGRGTVVMRDADAHEMHNNTSTKQTISSATALVALAVERSTNRYWHSYDPLTPPGPPVADFSGSPTSGTAPLTVAFSDRSTGLPRSWTWDFGDGTGSTSQNPSHTYNTAGTYTVTLTASNAAGSDTETKAGYITVGASTAPPVADFTASPRSGTAPLAVSFTDLSTGSPTSWAWSFGDGTTATTQNPTHTYSASGTYTVSLTVTSGNGTDSETKAGYITVGSAGTPLTFTPVADARVEQANPTLNFGDHTTVRVKQSSSTSYESYLRFTVSGLTGAVRSAKLRLWVTDASPDAGSLYTVSNDWQEATITWNSRPPISGTPIATVGSASTAGTWIEVDLTSSVTGNGTYNFGMKTTSTDAAWFSSKEGSHPPQLVVTPLS